MAISIKRKKSFQLEKSIKNRVDLELWRNPEFEVYFYYKRGVEKPYFKAF